MDTYSKGMMQRVGLAQALVNDPELIVLDEPTDGVDVQGRRDVRDVLLKLKGQGKTIFLNSHLLSELELVCDEVAILNKGRVIKQGLISDLTVDRQRFEIEMEGEAEKVAGMLGSLAVMGAGNRGTVQFPGGEVLQLELAGNTLKVTNTDAASIQPIIDRLRAQGGIIRRVQSMRPSLEELFIESVEGAAPAKKN
jgi:ABC-2 type transport system ATP-binding protein